MTLKLSIVIFRIIVLNIICSGLITTLLMPAAGALLIAGCFFITIPLGLSSCTIMLNTYHEIRQSKIASFLSFFLFPSIMSAILLTVAKTNATDFKIYSIIIASYLAITTFFFFRFFKVGEENK